MVQIRWYYDISTHILTKRMTMMYVTVSESNVFQLTSSRRGWHDFHVTFIDCISISTHILTKRMTQEAFGETVGVTFQLTSSRRGWLNWEENFQFQQIFQLTSSRRGWRNDGRSCAWRIYFNSHPHEEDDGWLLSETAGALHFNSHPHEEDDHYRAL